MKIYPSKHRIKQVAGSNIDRDIAVPLAYLNNDNITYKISRSVNDNFSVTSKKEVLPNQILEDENVLLFDEFGNAADSSTVINRNGEDYYYYPNNMIEFTPLQFSYKVTAKKAFNYSIAKKFNLNMTCIDDKNTEDFMNRVMKILMAPSEKGFVPNNILINSNKKDKESFSMAEIDYKNTDFVLLESYDGMHYNFAMEDEYTETNQEYGELEYVTNNAIAYETFWSSNVNTWIVTDDHYKYPVTHGRGCYAKLKSPMISKENEFHVKDYYNVNDPAFRGVNLHNIFDSQICPVLIIEHENKAFSIICSTELFSENNISTYKALIYEVLMYVYCNSYKQSDYVNEYITYTLPDYEIKSNQLNKKTSFISDKNLNDLLRISSGNYNVCNVEIMDNNETLAVPDEDLISTVDGIICKGVSNNKLVFHLDNKNQENGVYKEPQKPTGWKSIYYNNKIYYLEQIHYLMETNIGKNQNEENRLFLIENGVDLIVRLYPFKSSRYGLNITKDLKVVIPFIKTTVRGQERVKNESYTVYMNLATKTLDFCYESEWEESEDKVYLAVITVAEIKSDQYLTDMRLKGGGLPEDMPDNFNLLDIGHIYGRPYRQANTLVITLPKKYEQYKNEILEVVEKYKVAEDYTILFFEDEDGENS